MDTPSSKAIRQGEATALAQQLVRIPSITGAEGLEISRFVCDWLRRRKLRAELVPAGPERASVVCEIGTGEPVLLLNAHLDTKWVEGMRIDPFGGEIKDGRLYGRGACDTKGAVAAMMVAADAFAHAEVQSKGVLRLVFEVGEEGPEWVAEELWAAGYLVAVWAVVGEPSGGRVEIGNRGRLTGAVRTTGISTHTATAERGVNAIQKMASVLEGLYELPFLQEEDPLWGRPPMNVWRIESKGWEATLPYECTAYFDTRLNPQSPPERALEQIGKFLKELCGSDPEMNAELVPEEMSLRLPAAYTHPEHELVRTARKVLGALCDGEAPIGANPAMTMAHVLICHGVPAIIYGPGAVQRAHTADEWVDPGEIELAAQFYLGLAERLLTAGSGAGDDDG